MGERQLVVGAAIVRGARVLAARRTTPAAAAGRYELPGGKVEPGELPSAALEREIAEELDCEIEVTTWLAGTSPISDTLELRIAVARLVAGEPEAHEHDRLIWVGADELDGPDGPDWMDADRPFLPELAHVLRAAATAQRRAVLFDEDDAGAVLRRLRADGYDAELERERLAGEDDDEDHPWAVLTDAPGFIVEMLVDEYDGWLDEDAGAPAPPPVAPLDLPTAPRRIKRPGADS